MSEEDKKEEERTIAGGAIKLPAGYKTPGERRAEARKKASAKKKRKAAVKKKIRSEVKTVKKTATAKRTVAPKGRVMSTEEVSRMYAPARKEVEENIIFRPNEGPQTEFLAAPETDVLYGGQAGGGKSFSLIVDPLRYAHKAKHRGLILRKTLKELRELIDNTRELYPKAFPGAKYKETEKVWVFPSGAKIEFGYLEKDSDVYQYQGQSFSWIGFDEITHLPTEFAWNYLASRLRITDPEIVCYMRCTANPGGVGHHWVKARYIDPSPPNEPFVYGTNPVTKAQLTRKFIPARLADNPYLASDGRYEAMLQSLPEVERRRLLDGDWDINEGAAFPEFQKTLHVIEPFEIPKHWFRVKGVDYGFSSPSACLWAAIDPDDGTMIIYRELYQKGLTGEELGGIITEMETSEARSVPGVLDTAAWNRTGYTGPTIGEILNRPPYSLKLRPADKNRVAGKVQVHQRLRPNKTTGRPQLQVFSTCTNLIRELQSLPLSKSNSEDVDTHAEDHAYDALRYIVMSRPKMHTQEDLIFKFKQEGMFVPSDQIFGY